MGDVFGRTGNMECRLSSIFPKCLYGMITRNEILRNRVDYLIINSLCEIPHFPALSRNDAITNTRFRLFLLLQNPVTLQPLDLILLNTTSSILESILCHNDRKDRNIRYTEEEFQSVKKFLKEKSHVGILHHYDDAIRMFQQTFHWNSDNKFVSCLKHHLDEVVFHQARVLDYNRIGVQQILKDGVNPHLYDLRLYLEFASLWID